MKSKIKTNAARILEANKISYELLESGTGDEFVSGLEMAVALNVSPKLIYKTLVLVGNSKKYYVCVISAEDELDLKKVAKTANEKKIDMIPVKDILSITGYVKGGCSPIGMKKLYTTFIDSKANDLDEIIISAGKRGYQIKLSPKDLVELVKAKTIDLV